MSESTRAFRWRVVDARLAAEEEQTKGLYERRVKGSLRSRELMSLPY